jgi:hypothetical protein
MLCSTQSKTLSPQDFDADRRRGASPDLRVKAGFQATAHHVRPFRKKKETKGSTIQAHPARREAD